MAASPPPSSSPSLVCLRFEVFGRVQGVNFRRATAERAQRLGVQGWVANTESGSVKGEAVGDRAAVEAFQRWVAKEGSPHSRIERADVHLSEVEGGHHQYSGFDIRRE